MSLRVFHGDANPAIDPFSFRLSDARALELVESGQGRPITLPDGRQAVQLYRNRAQREEEWRESFADVLRTPATINMPPLELPGLRFRLSKREITSQILQFEVS